MRSHATLFLLLLLVLGAALGGCLDRTETITVHPNGAVDIVHRIRGDGGDLDGGAARYPGPEAWTVERSVEKEDGQEKHVLVARASFASAKDIPTHFGPADGPFAAQALHFTTGVDIRREDGRTVYRFARVYAPRTWGPYRYFDQRAFPESVRELTEGGRRFETLSPEQQRRVLAAHVENEKLKMQHWAQVAIDAVAPDHPRRIDAILSARAAIADYCAAQLSPAALEGVLARPPEEVAALAQRTQRDVRALAAGAARGTLGLDAAGEAEVAAAYDTARRDYEVTEDLGDENFTVRLRLPGRLVADNGNAHEDGCVVWKFGGEDLRDRSHTLLAVSVVE